LFIGKDILTNKLGKSSYRKINYLIKKITHLKKRPILVILSQVYPGFTRKIDWPKEKLFYQVETLIFGQALFRAINPERIIVGSCSKDNQLKNIFFKFLKNFSKNIIHMNYESAELCKLSINAYLISQVTLTNKLNEISRTLNSSWEDIKKALLLDKRIGRDAYISPGLGISGGNLERDLVTLKTICNRKNINTDLFNVYKNYSYFYKNWISQQINKIDKNKLVISVVGITYKANTNSIKNSASVYFIKKNLQHSYKIYDPLVQNIPLFNNKKIIRIHKLDKNFLRSDVIVIFNLYKNIYPFLKKNIKTNQKIVIIDPYKLMKITFVKNLKKYITL
jgi:UDPglucose 6-dehydrogenase